RAGLSPARACYPKMTASAAHEHSPANYPHLGCHTDSSARRAVVVLQRARWNGGPPRAGDAA
ncbi:MAG: hypothetical protein ACRD2F_09220, partial [Terriglobales bacterium]